MQQITGRGVNGSYLVIVLMIAMALLLPAWVSAEESLTDSTPQPPPVEPTPTPVIDAPVIPEPAEPTVVPTEEPTATADPEPGREQTPPPDAPRIPAPLPIDPTPESMEITDIEGSENTPIGTPSSDIQEAGTPESLPTATSAPAPVISLSHVEPVSCQLSGESASTIAYAASQTWHCSTAATVSGDSAALADGSITWFVDVTFPDADRLHLPADSSVQVSSHSADSASHYTIDQPLQSGDIQHLAFDVEILRTTCATGEQILTVQAVPKLSAGNPEVEVVQADDSTSATSHAIEYAPNLAPPEASMTEVDFGRLSWDGESWGSTRASSTITVTNPHPCVTTQPHAIQLWITADNPGMQPTLVSVNASGNQIDVIEGSGSTIAIVPAGFSGTAVIEVEFELAPSVDSPPGNHQFGFEVTTVPAP